MADSGRGRTRTCDLTDVNRTLPSRLSSVAPVSLGEFLLEILHQFFNFRETR